MQGDPDAHLVSRFKKGEQGAFDELVRRYQKQIYYLALRMTGNREDAEDIAQETFVKAYEALENFREESSFFTWIYRIAVNLSINHYYKEKLRRFVSLNDLIGILSSHSPPPDSAVEGDQINRAVKKALEGLPAKQKMVFVLRQYEGLSFPEIAEVTGRTVGSVKANYFHAVRKLRRALKDLE